MTRHQSVKAGSRTPADAGVVAGKVAVWVAIGFSVAAVPDLENRETIATNTASCRKRKGCFIMPRLFGGLYETVVTRRCSDLGCVCRGAAVPGAKRFHTGSG